MVLLSKYNLLLDLQLLKKYDLNLLGVQQRHVRCFPSYIPEMYRSECLTFFMNILIGAGTPAQADQAAICGGTIFRSAHFIMSFVLGVGVC
jgi:hypothetical protein